MKCSALYHVRFAALGGGVRRRVDTRCAPAFEIGWSTLDLAPEAGVLEASLAWR
jgi:hypothetical protein